MESQKISANHERQTKQKTIQNFQSQNLHYNYGKLCQN